MQQTGEDATFSAEDWKGVRSGLTFIYRAGGAITCILVVFFVLDVANKLVLPEQAAAGAITGFIVGLVAIVAISFVLVLVGLGRCCSVPPESGARRAAILAFACACIATGILPIASITDAAAGADRHDPIDQQGDPEAVAARNPVGETMLFLGNMFLRASMIGFTLFLRRLGHYFGSDALARNSLLLIISLVVVALLVLLLELGPDGLSKRAGGQLLILAANVGLLATLVWSLILVHQARVMTALQLSPAQQ